MFLNTTTIEVIYCLTKREKEIYLLYTTKNSLGRQFLRQDSGQFRDLLTTRKQFAVLRRHLEMNANPNDDIPHPSERPSSAPAC